MKSVNIGDLRNQLSAYLRLVKNGEEVVVRDRHVPIARILPFELTDLTDGERRLVASGEMKLSERPVNWEEFWSLPSGKVAPEIALQAVLDERSENR